MRLLLLFLLTLPLIAQSGNPLYQGSTINAATADALSANPAALTTGTWCNDLNADGTCASEQDLDDAAGDISATQVEASLRYRVKSITIENPTTADSGKVQFTLPNTCTFQRLFCSTDTGTVTIDLDERSETTPNSAGTEVIDSGSTNLVCDSDTEVTASFVNGTIAIDAPVALIISATSGTPGVLRVHARCNLN